MFAYLHRFAVLCIILKLNTITVKIAKQHNVTELYGVNIFAKPFRYKQRETDKPVFTRMDGSPFIKCL